MSHGLVIHVHLHEGRYHGEGDWPPCPARLFQALVAAAGLQGGEFLAVFPDLGGTGSGLFQVHQTPFRPEGQGPKVAADMGQAFPIVAVQTVGRRQTIQVIPEFP